MSDPLLSLENVSRTYTRGLHALRVLRDVSLEVHPGEFIAIFGQPCSGKTTLLKVAAGFESPDAGIVRFGGEDLNCIPARRLADLHNLGKIGWVHRSGPLSTELPALEHVALPLLSTVGNKQAHCLAKDALAQLGAEACAHETWGNLADAERMWVALAQALVRRPQLLLVDDPTAGLDVLERQRVFAVLRALADDREVGVVITVADLPAMLRAHDVRALSGGSLIAPPAPPGDRGTVIDFPGGERSA